MKAIHLTLLIIGLIAIAHTTTTTTHQGALKGKNSGHILRKTNLGRALLSMVEMYSKNKDSSMEDLFSALALLKQSLLDKKAAETQNFIDEGNTHQSEVNRLQGRVDEFEEKVITYTNDLNTLNNEASVLASELLNQQGQLQSTNNQLQSESEAITTLEANFEETTSSFTQTIDLLTKALDALDKASMQASDAFTSFVQTNQKTLQELALTIEDSVSRFTNTKAVLMKPISHIFAQIRAGEQVDAESIGRAREAVFNLQNYLTMGLEQSTLEYNTQKTAHEDMVTSLTSLRDSLQNEQIPATQVSIETNASNISDKEGELSTAETDRDHYQSLLDDENTSWEARVESHNEMMPQFDNEHNIVVQAENVLNAQNI